jgi:hypothetical protein
MINIVSCLLLGILTLGCINSDRNTESLEQQKNCLRIENFHFVASFVEEHGLPIKTSERLLADKESLSLEFSIGGRLVLLENYPDHNIIIILDKNEGHKIPIYSVSNRNKEIQISAYYSRFDTDEDAKVRAEDWCNLVSVVTKKR